MKTLALLILLTVTHSAHAALTLTVNTTTKMLSWSGNATSPAIVVGTPIGQTNVGITTAITDTFNGGNFFTSAVSSGAGLSVNVVSGITIIPPSAAANPGQVWSNTTNSNMVDSISVLLGNINLISGTDTTTYTVTANAGSFDYSTLDTDQEALLEGANGTRLFFSDTRNMTDLGTAGSIVVTSGTPSVPEPSTYLLGGLTLLGVWFLRRKRCLARDGC